MRPEFSNSKIMIKDNIKIDDKVEAACWLNVEDEDLRKRMVAYFNDTTKKNINVVLSRRIGDLGSSVRGFCQRCSDYDRQLYHGDRTEVESLFWFGDAVAAWLRRPRTRALLCTFREILATLRRRQCCGCQRDDSG